MWVLLGNVSLHYVINKNTIANLTPGKECYIYAHAFWNARGIVMYNMPWQLNVSEAENISTIHTKYRNQYGEAGGTDAWGIIRATPTANTISVISQNQGITNWDMVCVVQ